MSAPDRAAEPAGGKRIVLFSDGTGNSSGKLFKTNVWRTYEAVDLGPAAPGRRPQIAFYDNGVGTSAFRPLAALGGIFGFGLTRNILEIYRYACRNYRPAAGEQPGADAPPGGDEIYGFGFSRGAFTMRLVIALIASQGLVPSVDEAELNRRSRDAYRAFRRDFCPRQLKILVLAVRAIRDFLIALWRRRQGIAPYDKARNYRPEIRFVGVWDTVGAYGGPITEIVRAIDNWFYPLSMPDYRLDPRVRAAAQALSLDDERDAFHPIVWDEVHEDELVRKRIVPEGRIKQVWFTGMHADVGGGYPDESLSYVSLLWMLHEAQTCGLRTLTAITDRFRALASSAGPIHDSRSGPGAYYRYQPRKLAAWMAGPPDIGSLYQRDPTHVDDDGRPCGFLPRVYVHESVAARIAHGTDRYAPFTLPGRITIAPLEQGNETARQSDSVGGDAPPAEAQPVKPMLDPALRRRLEDAAFGAERVAAMERVWDLVWRRRVAYFATLSLTFALAALPLWADMAPEPPVLADGRTWVGEIVRLLNLFLPAFAEGWVNVAAANSFYVLLLGLLIAALMLWSGAMERRLRDRARAVWRDALAPERTRPAEPPEPAPRLRTRRSYQRFMQAMKWTVMPAVIGLALLAFLGWAVLSLATQWRLPALERSAALGCPLRDSAAPPLVATRRDFSPRDLCTPVRMTVEARRRYVVDLQVVTPWRDGRRDATPAGLGIFGLRFPTGLMGLPLRRVVNARYLQPAYLIRSVPGWRHGAERVFIQPLAFRPGADADSWRAEFRAERSGDLSLFANDSMLPFGDGRFFYERTGGGNTGTACLTIRRADLLPPTLPAPRVGSACATAVARAALAAPPGR